MEQLNRKVICILGLPFDLIDMDGAVEYIHNRAKDNNQCFLSTPNLNFLIESHGNKLFRDSVINSDLSVIDGKPLVWIARLLKLPVPERVSGSDLFDELVKNKRKHNTLKVFFFGGKEGIAKKACEKLNSNINGLECVGYLYPGFVSVDEMSTEKNRIEINKNNPDFCVVSLGAMKGQAWIEQNKDQLTSPVISHLGAVVNFIAGDVKRSPKILQKLGLEWLWRIKEEPYLWRRYKNDGLNLLKLFLFNIIPLFYIMHYVKPKNINHLDVSVSQYDTYSEVTFKGFIGLNNIIKVNKAFEESLYRSVNVSIVIEDDSYIDNYFLGKIFLLKNLLNKNNLKLTISVKSKHIKNVFKYNCCSYLMKE